MVKRWSGFLILGMWLLNLLHLYLDFSPWPAAIAAWAASLLTWPWLVGPHGARRWPSTARRSCCCSFPGGEGPASAPVTGSCRTSTC